MSRWVNCSKYEVWFISFHWFTIFCPVINYDLLFLTLLTHDKFLHVMIKTATLCGYMDSSLWWEGIRCVDMQHFLLCLQITGLSFSSTDSTCVYIQGVDYEVLCITFFLLLYIPLVYDLLLHFIMTADSHSSHIEV